MSISSNGTGPAPGTLVLGSRVPRRWGLLPPEASHGAPARAARPVPAPPEISLFAALTIVLLAAAGCEGTMTVWGGEWPVGGEGGPAADGDADVDGAADGFGSPTPATPDGGSALTPPPGDEPAAEEEPPPDRGCGGLEDECCRAEPMCDGDMICVMDGGRQVCLARCTMPTCRYGGEAGECLPLIGGGGACMGDRAAPSGCDGSRTCVTEYGASDDTLCVTDASGTSYCLETCEVGGTGCDERTHMCVELVGDDRAVCAPL